MTLSSTLVNNPKNPFRSPATHRRAPPALVAAVMVVSSFLVVERARDFVRSLSVLPPPPSQPLQPRAILLLARFQCELFRGAVETSDARASRLLPLLRC